MAARMSGMTIRQDCRLTEGVEGEKRHCEPEIRTWVVTGGQHARPTDHRWAGQGSGLA